MRLALLVAALFTVSCAQNGSTPSDNLIENQSSTSHRVKGLARLNTGAFVQGTNEALRAVYDTAGVKTLEWTATAGALSTSGDTVTWTLPELDTAALTLTLVMNDGARVDTRFDFALVPPARPENPVKSAHEALLSAPMPVLDGGSDVSGGACELEYDTSGNVHLAFTSSTHPAIYYAKWNGTTWTIELIDTLGFNTGGLISTWGVHVKVDGNGDPHILYRRDNQLRYATRTGTSAWTMERVDGAVPSDDAAFFFAINNSGKPAALYRATAATSPYTRSILATRTAVNTWSNTNATPAGTYGGYPLSDVAFNSAGTAYFATYSYDSSNNFLASFNGTTASTIQLTSELPSNTAGGSSSVWAGTNRLLMRTSRGVYDFGINTTTFANTTQNWWALEQNGSSNDGDIAWNGRPVVLHQHGYNLELVTTVGTGASFWSWQQLGTTDGYSASVAVHPSTGAASICYQAGGRIMFQ